MSLSMRGRPCGRPAVIHAIIQIAEALHLVLGIPGYALAAIAELVGKRAERREAAIGVGIVALDHRDLRRGDAGDEIAFALLPILDVEGLREFGRRVVLDRGQYHIALDAEMANGELREAPVRWFCRSPSHCAIPRPDPPPSTADG